MPELKVAGVQMDLALGEVEANLEAMATFAQQTTSEGAWLTVFPECTTTGYCFSSKEEALDVAETRDGPSVQRVHQLCQELQTRIIFGFLERANGHLFNSLALVSPDGVQASYRKVHLPMLGVDRYTTSGDQGFPIADLPEIRIGLNICYDISFPESARVLSLMGADLIVLPTNWPPTSGLTADVIPPARALENHVYFMAINRIGQERGFRFIGKSRICDPTGKTLVFADHDQEAVLYANINVDLARSKHLVNIPGEHEVHRINDRRPAWYGKVVDLG